MKKAKNLKIMKAKKTTLLLSLILMYVQIIFAINIPRPEHYKVKNGNPYDPVWTIYFEQGSLNIGDEIGVFDGDILVGSGIVVSENILDNVIPVFSNLYKVGNKPVLKVWDKNEQEEYLITDYSFSNPYVDAWIENVFPENDAEYSLLNFSITGIHENNIAHPSFSIYPNPSDGIFNISIENFIGDLQCKIIGLQGNDFYNYEFSGINGYTVKQLDLSKLPAGIYLVLFNGKNFNQIKKIVVN